MQPSDRRAHYAATAVMAEPSIRVITAATGRVSLGLGSIWSSREVALLFAARDLRLRYRQTLLGIGWVILQPLFGGLILGFVFGAVAGLPSGGLPYPLLAFAGLVAWNIFSTAFTKASLALVQNPQLVSKVFLERLSLPIGAALPSMVDALMPAVLVAAAASLYGIPFSLREFSLALLAAVLLLTQALGAGFVLSSLAVTYRDVPHLLPTAVQLFLFASPVAYTLTAVPETLRVYLSLNPLTVPLELFRYGLLRQGVVEPGAIVASTALSALGLLFGIYFFRRREASLADVI